MEDVKFAIWYYYKSPSSYMQFTLYHLQVLRNMYALTDDLVEVTHQCMLRTQIHFGLQVVASDAV